MNREKIGLPKQLFLGYARDAGGLGRFDREILTPSYNLHTECNTDTRNLAADPPKSHHPQGFAIQLEAYARLPPAVPNGITLVDYVTSSSEYKRPGQFNGGGRPITRRADVDPPLLSRRRVNRCVH